MLIRGGHINNVQEMHLIIYTNLIDIWNIKIAIYQCNHLQWWYKFVCKSI